jgi:hypothetical protein
MTYRCRSLCGIGNSENGAGVVGHKVQEHSFPSFGSAIQRFIDVVDQWKCQNNGGGVGIVAVAVLAIIAAKYNIGENGLRKKGALNLVQKGLVIYSIFLILFILFFKSKEITQ